jgi:CubicO group peptidase (beta-lactamase class C family)
MRIFLFAIVFAACSSPAKPEVVAPQPAAPDPAASTAPPAVAPSAVAARPVETLAADTPKTTVAGNTFIAPSGWSFQVRGAGTILEAPERGSFIAIYDLPEAKDADSAVAQAWQQYKGKQPYELQTTVAGADRDGWTELRGYQYQVSPNEQRAVGANAQLGNGAWTVVLFDLADAVAEKRGAQLGLMLGKLLPKGGARESFAGTKAQALDAPRIEALRKFVEDGMRATGVPGVAFGLVEGGKVIYAGGVGVRELGKPAKVDGDTKFMIASNTKALATLMLARLVDAKKITWETPATSLLPSFKLGDADTTGKVLVKHLICACTGLPRQDMEWLFQWAGVTPAKVLEVLGTMQPTSKFGELFQYSNPLAAAAGFIGGHVAYPKLELGAAFDQAMQTEVFSPLGMTSTTFDFAKGQRGNAAVPHSPNVDGKTALAIAKVNTSIVPVRPAGGAWSTIKDMLKYVQMELAEGRLPNGKTYVGKEALLARRAPQVAVGTDATYGMGLMVDKTWGITVVHHGGDMIGFHSDMMWLPEFGIGAVVLTNGDLGWLIRSQFQRKLLEVLFDGRPEADARLAASAKAFFASQASERKLLTIPADATAVAMLAPRYSNPALGEISVGKSGAATRFDFGEYASDVASKKNPDGTTSFVTIVPGVTGLELVAGTGGGKRTLTLRDAQHEYVFTEAAQ